MSDRARVIADFLKATKWGNFTRGPLAGDASFRRYERLNLKGESVVLMDAPPPMEDVRPFAAVTRFLTEHGFIVPTLLAENYQEGLLLIDDLGDDRFKDWIEVHPVDEVTLYKAAIDVLVNVHKITPPKSMPHSEGAHNLPNYDHALLTREVDLLQDWFYPAMTGGYLPPGDYAALWQESFDALLNDPTPNVLVLRDYHAENLMWLSGDAQVGLLDYQDAVSGHPAYDLVSLLQDARRDVPPALEIEMIDYYLARRRAEGMAADGEQFKKSYAILGAQRNAKIIGIFSRLWIRDDKAAYLDLMPRVWGLLMRNLHVSELADFKTWVEAHFNAEIRNAVPDGAFMRDRFPVPHVAMIMAAGKGTRMGALSDQLPKPLVSVNGTPLLTRIMDHCFQEGVGKAVVNVHHLADQVEDHLSTRKIGPEVIISDERSELLETGGGVMKALPLIGGNPFYVINSDALWHDEDTRLLQQLAAKWDAGAMDILLIAIPTENAMGYDGVGDFYMNDDGVVSLRGDRESAPYMFGGVRIMKPCVFDGETLGAWSMRRLFRKAAANGRLHATVYNGHWMHVGDIQALASAEGKLKSLGDVG